VKGEKQNLFNILKRSPWWMSALIAAALFAGANQLLNAFFAFFVALPFAVISVYSAGSALGTPGAAKVATTMETLRSMSWEDFSALMAEAFRRDGYDVAPLASPGADFELRKQGRTAVASCRRWKASQGGTGPLKDALAAMKKAGANDCLFVTVADLSPNARDFAIDNAIELVDGARLVTLVRRVKAKMSPPK
jgi:restriction system protein